MLKPLALAISSMRRLLLICALLLPCAAVAGNSVDCTFDVRVRIASRSSTAAQTRSLDDRPSYVQADTPRCDAVVPAHLLDSYKLFTVAMEKHMDSAFADDVTTHSIEDFVPTVSAAAF